MTGFFSNPAGPTEGQPGGATVSPLSPTDNLANDSSFFHGEVVPPETSTTDKLIDTLQAQVQGVADNRVLAQQAATSAAASAGNAKISEDNVAGLAQQATTTLEAANVALDQANDLIDSTTANAATATTKAAEASASAAAAASSQAAALSSKNAAATSETNTTNSAAAALAHKNAAATSEANSAASAAAALASKNASATSETNSAASAASALSSKNASATSETNSAASAAAASASQSASATSETNAAESASDAADSAAAAQAAQAAAGGGDFANDILLRFTGTVQRGVRWLKDGLARWGLIADGTNGDALTLARYNDAGTYIDNPVTVSRATGDIALSSKKISGLANGTAATEAVNKSQLDTKVNKTGDGITGSLNFSDWDANVGAIRTTKNIGGGWVDWRTRQVPLQIDAADPAAAYGGLRWTQWGSRHLASIEAYAGGSTSSEPVIVFHTANQNNTWTFHRNGIDRGLGGSVWGTWNINPPGTDNCSNVGFWGGDHRAPYFTRRSDGNVTRVPRCTNMHEFVWNGSSTDNYVDGTYQGALLTSTNYSWWAAPKGGRVQWDSGAVETAGIDAGQTRDLPAPYVCIGLRNAGSAIMVLRGVVLRNY